MIEIVLVGVAVGLAVVGVRVLTVPGSQLQWIALVVGALLVTAVHVLLRHQTTRTPPASPNTPQPRPPRVQPEDLFANELDQSWTGLSDPEEASATTGPRRNRDSE